tara:strand:+ start:3261 stop:3446 length:186 start_codon:yes stop_codon:yes gene_type:complete
MSKKSFNTYLKETWESSTSVEIFLNKIGEPSDTIVILEEKGIIDVYNDNNGYVYINLNEGE